MAFTIQKNEVVNGILFFNFTNDTTVAKTAMNLVPAETYDELYIAERLKLNIWMTYNVLSTNGSEDLSDVVVNVLKTQDSNILKYIVDISDKDGHKLNQVINVASPFNYNSVVTAYVALFTPPSP